MVLFDFMHLHSNIFLFHDIERNQTSVPGFYSDVEVGEVEFIILYGKAFFIQVQQYLAET